MKRLFLIAASVFLFSVQNSFADDEPEIQGTLCISNYDIDCRFAHYEGEIINVGFTEHSRNGVFILKYELKKYGGFFEKHFNIKILYWGIIYNTTLSNTEIVFDYIYNET